METYRMTDNRKTEELMVQEVEDLRRRIAELEKSGTERKRVEEALRESEDRYRGLFEHSFSCVAIYEAVDDGGDFVIKNFNTAGERAENIARDLVIGKRVTEVFPGVTDFGLLDVLQRVWRTGEPAHHPVTFYRDRRIQGWRENYVYRLPSGEIAVVYEDITDRKRVEEALRESEENYRNLFENAKEAIFVAQAGKIVFLNPRTTLMFGYSGDELVSRPFVEFIYQDDRDMVMDRQIPKIKRG